MSTRAGCTPPDAVGNSRVELRQLAERCTGPAPSVAPGRRRAAAAGWVPVARTGPRCVGRRVEVPTLQYLE